MAADEEGGGAAAGAAPNANATSDDHGPIRHLSDAGSAGLLSLIDAVAPLLDDAAGTFLPFGGRIYRVFVAPDDHLVDDGNEGLDPIMSMFKV